MNLSLPCKIITGLILLLYFWITESHGFVANHENRLRNLLFRRYKPQKYQELPIANRTDNVTVKFALEILHVIQLDEQAQTLIVKCIAQMEWEDVGLRWNKADFGGVDTVNVSPDWIWTPDLGLYNSAKAEESLFLGPGLVKVSSTGVVKWEPPVTLHANCPINLWYYPRDQHVCEIRIGSWTYDGATLNLKFAEINDSKLKLMDPKLAELNPWEVEISEGARHVMYYACCPEPYVTLNYDIKLTRRAAFYNASLLPSFFAILILANALFWLPPSSTEKTTLGALISLLLLIMLLHLMMRLPNTTNGVPAIIGICAALLFFSTLSFIVSIVTINLSQRSSPPSGCLLRIGSSKAAHLLGVGIRADQTTDANCDHDDQSASQWSTIARGIDRVCFGVYFIASIIFVHLFCT